MKGIYGFFAVLAILIALTAGANVYAADSFTVSLKYGDSGAEVTKLQNFLVTEGFLKTSLVTGNFFSLTQTAVKEFQKKNGIDQTGFFGPLTRAAANGKVAVAKPKASGSIVSVEAEANTASVALSKSRTVSWQTSNYPVDAGVDVNLLRKTSDKPLSYVLVEKIAKNTKNDGVEVWTPKVNASSDLYIEVTCSSDYNFKDGCAFTGAPVKAF